MENIICKTYSKSIASPVGKPKSVPKTTVLFEPSNKHLSILAGFSQSDQNKNLAKQNASYYHLIFSFH